MLLQQAGQTNRALAIYSAGAEKLDVDGHGNPLSEVALPAFGTGAGQVFYTPQRFQAMADLGIAVDKFQHEGYASTELLPDLQKAVQLAPHSAAAHYFLGKYLLGKNGPGAKAELQKAVQLGDAQTAAAAKRKLQFVH